MKGVNVRAVSLIAEALNKRPQKRWTMENKLRELTSPAGKLTKNALGFSWTLSLFGAQQLANLFAPTKAAAAFENATRTMRSELSDTLRSAHRMGELLQDQMIGWAIGETPGDSMDSMPNPDPSRPLSSANRAAGWGPMPFPVFPPSAPGTAPLTAPEISPEFPYEPHFIDVYGSRMHFVDVGSGDPILLLHGNPTWSYLWRNIIPYLTPLGRCIAPDLVGFGRSDKPDIEYRWKDHVRYLEAFIAKLGLRNITLVLHDQGSGLGLHYAMRHEDNIKGIALFEAIIRPYPWDQFSTPEFRELFRKFRTGGIGGEGWKMIVDQNVFIEQLLPQSAGRKLSETEMNYYREPFKDRKSRLPVWRFPQETPIGGEPQDVWDAVTTYSRRLQRSRLPKLLLYARPGALVTQDHLDWAKKNINSLETVYVGEGSHFLQESSPHAIGKEVARWIRNLPGNERLRDSANGLRRPPISNQPSSHGEKPAASAKPSAELVQRLIDRAAYFNLSSSPATTDHGSIIRDSNRTIGFHIAEALWPFNTLEPTAAKRCGTFSHRWMLVPDDFVGVPGRQPPATQFDPGTSQRFVMLDSICQFGNGRDGFYGFGTGRTFPTEANGRSHLSVAAVGTILNGFGSFAGHIQGTYVYCGELDPNGGFIGNLMLRVMDDQSTLHSQTSRRATEWQKSFDGQNTYVIFRGQAIPSDPVRPNIGPDGKPIGLVVEQGLTLQHVSNSLTSQARLESVNQVGDRRIGRVTAHVVFDPKYASGTNDDPVPFTAYDEFEFKSPSGDIVGKFIADSTEGRVFNTLLAGQPGIRFGGFGRIHRGQGLFEGIQGLMTDNSVVVFEPHVSASVYVLRVRDAQARIASLLNQI
jgi:haloalkane dehalogenase